MLSLLVLGSAGCNQSVAPVPPSIVLISVDTLRADRLSLYGYPRPTTPVLDRWAAERAAVFENTVAPAAWTVPSHLSMLTGLDAWRHGFNHDVGSLGRSLAAKVEAPLLAERLRDAGYTTAAETGGAYLAEAYGFNRGFDTYAAWPRPERFEVELTTLVDRAIEFVSRPHSTPYFFFLHTYDVHDPYRCTSDRWSEITDVPAPPKGTRIALLSQKPSPESGYQKQSEFQLRPLRSKVTLTPELINACYDAGVARMDAEVGRLLRALESAPGPTPLVILTSDHGEALGEYGRIGHNRLDDANLMVPLIIADPAGRGAGMRVERQVRLLDLVPTVLELLGQPAADGLDGRSLVPLMEGESAEIPPVAWSYSATGNRGISMRHGNRLKAIFPNTVWAPVRTPIEVFDLRQDPEEVHALENPELAGRLTASIHRSFTDHAVGLRLRLVNGGAEPFEGVIRSRSVSVQGVKSTDLACPCLEFETPDGARLRVQPGEDFTLHFERILGTHLNLETAGGSFRLPVADLNGRGTYRIDEDGTPHAVDGPLGRGVLGLELWWHGIGPVAGEPIEYDPELRRQLESLGYL
ncbi:MAG: sulfatase [Acidobacteriota bacterium]